MISQVSITNGVPTVGFSLVFIMSLSMVKDFLEDFKRWKSDKQENLS
jgi:hypothetical protein